MERAQSTDFARRNTPLFSVSAIGSPAAFSTAIKLPGSHGSRSQNTESPLTRLGQLPQDPSPQHNGISVTGRLSLSSTLSDKEGAVSLNNTSVGILDLDAMQDSSMHRFLTSPFDSQDLNLHMSSTMSVPSTQVSIGRTPIVGNINENKNGHTPYQGISLTYQSQGLPQELLLRQPGSEYSSRSSSPEGTETPDPFASHASSQDDDDNPLAIAEAIKGALDELELSSSSSLQSSYSEEETEQEPHPPPPAAEANVPTQQNSTATNVPLSLSPILQHVHPSRLNGSSIANGHSVPHRGSDASLKLEDLSVGGGERKEGGLVESGEGNGDETLIDDEVEPSVMREADEFSQFDPSHLASLMDKDSLAASLKSLENSKGIRTTSTTISSKLGSSLLPLSSSSVTHQPGAPVTKIITSARMSSFTSGSTKLRGSLPTERNKNGGLPSAGREGLKLDGGERRVATGVDISGRTESALSFASATSSDISGRSSPSHTIEGLPSAYLAPTSFLTDATDQSSLENSALASLSHSPAPFATSPLPPPSTSSKTSAPPGNVMTSSSHASLQSSSGSSLPSSLTELAAALGSEPFTTHGNFETPTTSVDMFGESGERMSARMSNGVYNPFDSDDSASVESFGQMEFGNQSSDSFLAQLAKDEEEIKTIQLTPSSEHLQSFTSVLGTSHFSTSLGGELSMDAYFKERSGKMGQLSAVKLPPNERPRFSDTTGHFIESPLVSDISPSTTASGHMTSTAPPTHTLESIPEGDTLDSTLVSESSTGAGKSHPQTTSTITTASITGLVRSLASSGTSNDLTPLVTSHSPFPVRFDVPKLDFANASTLSSQHISPPTFLHKSMLMSSSPLIKGSTPDRGSLLPHGESQVGLPPELLEPALVDDSSTSSLVFKEVSAISLSSPPLVLDPSFQSMATPSIAKLPGFDVTEMTTQHSASFLSSRDDASEMSCDQSLPISSQTMSRLEHSIGLDTTSPYKLGTKVPSPLKSQHQSRTDGSLLPTSINASPSKVPHSPISEHLSTATADYQVEQKISKKSQSPLKSSTKSPVTSAKPSPSKVIFTPKSSHQPYVGYQLQSTSLSRSQIDQNISTSRSSFPDVVKSSAAGAKLSPSKVMFPNKQLSPPPVDHKGQSSSPHIEQKLSTETLTTWSSGSPLTSPPQQMSLRANHEDISSVKSTTRTATITPASKSKSSTSSIEPHIGSSPKTDAARRKLANLQAQLDAACFNAEEFLATLKSNVSPPTTTIASTSIGSVEKVEKTSYGLESKKQRVSEKGISPSFTEESVLNSSQVSMQASLTPAKHSPVKKGRGTVKSGDESQYQTVLSEMPKGSTFSPTRSQTRASLSTTPSSASPQSKNTSPPSPRSGGKMKKRSSIPRPTKPFMTTPSAGSTARKRLRDVAPPPSEERERSGKRASGEKDKLSAATTTSSPKKSKPSRVQSESRTVKKRQSKIVHVNGSYTSSTSGGGIPLKRTSLGTESSASPANFTLSSLLTSHAQNSSTIVTPPSTKSTLTVSSLSSSPSPQSHAPPIRTATPPAQHPTLSSTLHPTPPDTSIASTSRSSISTHLNMSHSPTRSTSMQTPTPYPITSMLPNSSHAPNVQPQSHPSTLHPSPSHTSHPSTLHPSPPRISHPSTLHPSPPRISHPSTLHPSPPRISHPSTLHPSRSTSSHPHFITSSSSTTSSPLRGVKPTASHTVNSSILQVPESLLFDQVCCVGVSVFNHFAITNLGERWLQLEFKITRLYRDGAECSLSENTFSFPQRSFIGPEQQEPIKVTFSPASAGSYEAVVAVSAHLVVSSSHDSHRPLASVVVKGVAEEPRLELQTVSRSCDPQSRQSSSGTALTPPPSSAAAVLDYGVVVGGNSTSMQLRLANRGLAYLPLCLSITAKSALSQLYFSFGEVPQSLATVSPPSLSPSHLLHPHHNTLTITLPPRPGKGRGNLDWYTIDVCFNAPKRYIDDSTFDPGPPDEISAQLTISISGVNPAAGQLTSVPIQAIVGLARLHVPRALQAVSLSCCAGRVVTREVPFRNAGNIPLRVRLKISGDQTDLFTIAPDFLLMEPREESQVTIYFSPSSPVICDGVLMIHIEPNGPNYELKLHGTATTVDTNTTTATANMEVEPASLGVGPARVEAESAKEVPVEVEEGMLSCNKRVLYWGGVHLGNSVCQEVLLHNSHSVSIPLSLSIRHTNSPFKLRSVGGREDTSQVLTQHSLERRVELLPGKQLPVGVVYTPTSATVSLNALDITDLLHSKKYRIRLCGYGGSSQIEVVGGRQVSGECWVDLGEVTSGLRINTKLTVFNSGLRAAFITATCYPDKESSSPLPVDRASVTPSKVIVPPRQKRELQLVYHANERDEALCSSFPAPLASLKLTTGDEVLRQRLQKVISQRLLSSLSDQRYEGGSDGGGPWSRLRNASNKALMTHFPEQETVPSEPDFSTFELEDEEGIFEDHLTTLTLSLSGSSSTLNSKMKNNKTTPPSTAFTVSPPLQPATARLKHKLSLSNTPPVRGGVPVPTAPVRGGVPVPIASVRGGVPVPTTPVQRGVSITMATPQQSLTQDILTAYTHLLPDAIVGHYSEKHLDINNPYSSDLRWELSHSASPFVRKTAGGDRMRSSRGTAGEGRGGGGGEILKANYSVFWVSERKGTTPPQSTSKVPILFQPHDKGSFSQIWDLKVSCDEIGTKKLRISFGGKAVDNLSTGAQPRSHDVAPRSHDQQLRSHDKQSRSHDRTEQITKWLSQTQHHLVAEPVVATTTTKATPLKKTVYIKDDRVVFPLTKVGSKSTVKIRVCNRGAGKYKFDAVKPVTPFSIDHQTFDLGSRQCARLPVHFLPVIPGEYTGVLAIRTDAGHQTFAELRGKSLS